MHSSRLSDHPRITAHTDGGQTEGLFYLSGPTDYQAKAAELPLDERARTAAWMDGTLEGEGEIIFSMEQVAALAMAEGPDDEILTLVGPTGAKQDRFDETTQRWFEGQREGVDTDQIQVQRGQLRHTWFWVLQKEVVSATEQLANKAEDNPLAAIQTLNQIRALLAG